MNDLFRQHAFSYGEEGKKWFDSIPIIVKTFEKKWGLKVLAPYNLTYNYIAPVERFDGSHAVLKIGYPKDSEFQSEIDMLEACNGEGIVRLLKADRANTVILIEEVSPGTPLSEFTDDIEATKIHAAVMKRLWKSLPKNHHFITIAKWARALYEAHDPFPSYLVHKAIPLLEELLATSSPLVLTHADLHHDNILKSNRSKWLAIDPKGIAAEPCYDTTAMIRNPYKLLNILQNIDDLLQNRIQILSKELNFDPERIRKWCFVQTVLSGVWCRDDKNDMAHAIKVATALNRIEV